MTKRAARTELPKYHHGGLRLAVLAAAEAILERDGIQALTMRAVAVAVGVSRTAPNHHFGDLKGLASELAAVGYRRHGAILAEAMNASGNDVRHRRRAMGRAYVAFARTHPGLFHLMLRSELLDTTRPSLAAAIEEARTALWDEMAPSASGGPMDPFQQAARAIACWALVHGFAMLLHDGRLQSTIPPLSRVGVDSFLETLFDTALPFD